MSAATTMTFHTYNTHALLARSDSPTSTDMASTTTDTLKLDRKRSQDRLHQRRHRAKRKMQLSTLEQDVQDLRATVAALSTKRQRLSFASRSSSDVNSSTATTSHDSSARAAAAAEHALEVVREYFQVFQYGYSAIHQRTQEAFLRQTFRADAAGADVSGVDALVHQWRLYGSFFWSMLLEPTAMRVCNRAAAAAAAVDPNHTVVAVDAELHLRLRADLATVLCPQLAHHPALLQTIVDNVISVRGTYTFVVDARSGQVSSFTAAIDFIDALYRVLGSLVQVAHVVDGAQIAMCTGTILCALPTESVGAVSSAHTAAVAPMTLSPSQQFVACAPVNNVASTMLPTMAKSKQEPIGSGLNYRLQLNFLLSSAS